MGTKFKSSRWKHAIAQLPMDTAMVQPQPILVLARMGTSMTPLQRNASVHAGTKFLLLERLASFLMVTPVILGAIQLLAHQSLDIPAPQFLIAKNVATKDLMEMKFVTAQLAAPPLVLCSLGTPAPKLTTQLVFITSAPAYFYKQLH